MPFCIAFVTGQSLWVNKRAFNLATSLRKVFTSICKAVFASFTLVTVLWSSWIHSFLLALARIELARLRSRMSFFLSWSIVFLIPSFFSATVTSVFAQSSVAFWFCAFLDRDCFSFCNGIFKNLSWNVNYRRNQMLPFLLMIILKSRLSWTPISLRTVELVQFW